MLAVHSYSRGKQPIRGGVINRPDEMPEIKEYIRTALGSPSNGNKTTSIGTRASFSESVSNDARAMEVLQSPETIRTVAEEDGHPGRTPRFSILLGSPSVIRRILLGFGTNWLTASKAFLSLYLRWGELINSSTGIYCRPQPLYPKVSLWKG